MPSHISPVSGASPDGSRRAPARRAVEVVQQALISSPLGVVEYFLVAQYCSLEGLKPVPGSYLEEYLSSNRGKQDEATPTLDMAGWNLDDLVMAFETLVPPEEAKKYGAVFTPDTITMFMAREAARSLSEARGGLSGVPRVLDPAVGCGALLVATLRVLHEETGQPPHLIASAFTGVDISANSIRRARLLLDIACLSLGDKKAASPTLIEADGLYAELGTYDIVIANPPYVRYQQLTREERGNLARDFVSCRKGNFNLYFPFVERALTQVAENGVMVLITPNGFLTSASGGGVRTLIADSFVEAIVDFGHTRVFEAMTYTAITIGTRTSPENKETVSPLLYAEVKGVPSLQALPANWEESECTSWERGKLTNGKPWVMVGKEKVNAIRAISEAGSPLSEVADVRFGIATCRDNLYLLSGSRNKAGNYTKIYDGVEYEIEPGITRRCVKVAGITSSEELAASSMRIIYPYSLDKKQAIIMEEEAIIREYPKAYAYFLAIREELAKRDKGRKEYAAWYAYGRTQGLIPNAPRLLTPLYADKPRFMKDSHKDAVFLNGCSVATKPGGPSLEIISVILNSIVTHFYVQSTAVAITGGFYAYQKSQLSGIGIPEVTPTQVKKLLGAKKEETRDKIVCDLYGLDYETLKNFLKPAEETE